MIFKCVLHICDLAGSFWKNPQFQLALTAADVQGEDDDGDDDEDDGDDDEDDEEKTDNAALSPSAQKQKEKGKKCTVLVELLQKDCRSKRTVKFLYMAFHIYKVREQEYRGREVV